MRLAIAISLILGLIILGCLTLWWFRVKPVEQSSDEITDGDFCGWIDEGREG